MQRADDSGRLVVIGTGIRSIAQLTLEAIAWLEAADVVCYALADPVTQRWVVETARESEDLSAYYDPGTTRIASYAAMASRLLFLARAGRTVVAAFYGHPGVFTDPGHRAIAAARAEGIPAQMLPAVSAEDCLFADLGVDPGFGATQTFEATELMIRGRVPDPTAHVVIWQIAVLAQRGYDPGLRTSDLTPLVDYLSRFYPPDHLVTHYQGAQLVVCDPLIERVPLRDLVGLSTALTSTLYLPPVADKPYDLGLAAVLGLDRPSADGDPLAVSLTDGADHPDREWLPPLPEQAGRMYPVVAAISRDPSLLQAFRADPQMYVQLLGLDPIETWALLTRNAAWISACVRHGSGTAAAVALGLAETPEEAATFRGLPDGRLVRPRRPPAGRATRGRPNGPRG